MGIFLRATFKIPFYVCTLLPNKYAWLFVAKAHIQLSAQTHLSY